MAIGRSVQFRGVDNTVAAYERQDVAPWGLFQGTQFMQGYNGTDQKEGAELLEQYLRSLDSRSADGVTYTLCVYDGLQKGEKIKSGTKYDASFNFRLIDNIDGAIAGRSYYEQRIAGLEEKIEALTGKDDEPMSAKEQFFNGLGKLLDHPAVQQMLATKIVTVVDGLTAGITGLFAKNQPAAIGAIDQTGIMDEQAKLQTAVGILVQVDPLLGSHLLQLATVAQKDPAKYNQLISMLSLL